jgi:hypothetical protein
MVWLAPAAFAALALLAAPLIVHLLARRNTRRLVFPATHFVPRSEAAALRLRRPTDIALLLVRMAIVTAAVLAVAQPVFLPRWRVARWNARLARAVVVDTSRSVADAAIASRLADEELRGVFAGRRIDTPDLPDGIARAVRWLDSTAPARREIVLVSDFQRGAFGTSALTSIPGHFGSRVIRAGALPATGVTTSPHVQGWRGGNWQATTTVDGVGTAAVWTRLGDAPPAAWVSVAAAPADAEAAAAALGAAASPGVSAGDDSRRAVVRFSGAAPLNPPAQPIASAWIALAALRLREESQGLGPDPVVGEREGVMIVDAPIRANALEAASVIRAVMLAVRPATIVDPEAEVAAASDADLAAWRRDPAPAADLSGIRREDSDARWPWGLALLLLAIEWRLRRAGAAAVVTEVRADAA